MAKSSMEEFEN